MIRRRRNLMPPYEVMGSIKGAPPQGVGHSATEPSVLSRAPVHREGEPEMRGDSGWQRGAPITLRLPRGVVVLAGVVMLVVVLLAYFVGHAIGYRAAVVAQETETVGREGELDAATGAGQWSSPAQNSPTNKSPVTTAVRQPAAGGTVAATGGAKPHAAVTGQSVTGERRQPGLNYFILAEYNQPEATRLAGFLQANGVDAMINPRHNGRSFQVVALRGFPPDQLASTARREFEQELRRLGRSWKSQNKGPSDLADMYLAKY